jgi:hypothetical protein
MKKKILAGLILAGSTMFAAPRVSFGVGYRAPVSEVAAPPCPGPGYSFVDGRWLRDAGQRFEGEDYRRAPERFERSNERFEHNEQFEHSDRFEHAEHFRR